MKNKYLLTILLIIGIIFFTPKNVEAANPVPAFKCFYKTTVNETGRDKTYILKLVYVNGELRAAKHKDELTKLEIENENWELKEYKKLLSKVGIWDTLKNVGNSCPATVTTNNGYLYHKVHVTGTSGRQSYTLEAKKDGKSHKYELTSSGTQPLGSGSVSDKSCTYKNSKESPSTIDVYFYRTKYTSSYNKSNNKKIDSFWKTKNRFYAGSKNYEFGEVKRNGYYTSLIHYIENYSSKQNNCPEKIFYNSDNNRLVVATKDITDTQVQDTTNYLVGANHSYILYKLDKDKICRERKGQNDQAIAALEQRTNALESQVPGEGGDSTQAQIESIVNEYSSILSELEKFDKNIAGCEGSAGYDDLKNRGKALTDKLFELKRKIDTAIGNSTSLTEDQKTELLKKMDKAYAKMKKLSSLDPDIYNKPQDCGSIFGNPNSKESVAYIIQRILNYIKIIGPILVIILSSIDFIKAIWSSDDENMKKAQQKLAKRLVAAVLLFLLPSLVGLIISLINSNITDPTCGIQ